MKASRKNQMVILGAMVALTACLAGPVRSQETAAEKPAEPSPVVRTVALLGYEAKWLDDPAERKDLEGILVAVVSDRLAALDDVVAVERTDIDKVMAEQKLNLTGLVDEENRVQIGKLLGARFLLTGRGFKVGEEIYLTTKVINAETGQFKGIIIQVPLRTPLPEIVTKLCDKLAEKLPGAVQALSPKDTPELSPVEMLKRRLGGKKKSWLIATTEEHKGPPILDPAVSNELEHLLAAAGQEVKSLDKKSARSVTESEKKIGDFDENKSADYYVVGEAFSEFGQRLSESLVTCVARVELKVLDARTGNVVAAGSVDGRATDLSEQLAAKQALRKATKRLCLELAAKLEGAADKDKDGDKGSR